MSMSILGKIFKCIFGDQSKIYDDSKHLKDERIPDKLRIKQNVKLTNTEKEWVNKQLTKFAGRHYTLADVGEYRIDRVYGDLYLVTPEEYGGWRSPEGLDLETGKVDYYYGVDPFDY